jgi:hypothetical protein
MSDTRLTGYPIFEMERERVKLRVFLEKKKELKRFD